MNFQERLSKIDSFSCRECAVWFLVPSTCLAFLFTLFIATRPSNLSEMTTSAQVTALAEDFWFGFTSFGVPVGTVSSAIYFITLVIGKFFRPTLITAAVCFLVFGNVLASVVTFEKGDREIGILRPELTAEERAERDHEYWDALLLGGGVSALIGGAVALVFQGIAYYIRPWKSDGN